MAFVTTIKGVLCTHGDNCFNKMECMFIHPNRSDFKEAKNGLCPFFVFNGKCFKGKQCLCAHHEMNDFLANKGWESWESKLFGREAVPAPATLTAAKVLQRGIASLSLLPEEEKKPLLSEEEKKTMAAFQEAKQKMEESFFPIKKKMVMTFLGESIDATTSAAQVIQLLEDAKQILA